MLAIFCLKKNNKISLEKPITEDDDWCKKYSKILRYEKARNRLKKYDLQFLNSNTKEKLPIKLSKKNFELIQAAISKETISKVAVPALVTEPEKMDKFSFPNERIYYHSSTGEIMQPNVFSKIFCQKYRIHQVMMKLIIIG